jgi:NAD(P)-dependent dehydrogenase (short-subunit alcohol dehydrogenase family)
MDVDVTNEKAVDDSITQTVKEFGRIDYAFNNAGVAGAVKPTDQNDSDDFARVMAVNTTGVWLCQRAQIRQMLKQDKISNSARSFRGSIVNTASMYGVIGPSANIPATAYATSKHAVVGMTKADAVVYAPQGVKINAICPGYVATPLIMGTIAGDVEPAQTAVEPNSVLDRECQKVPLQRLATPEEIGDCVAFLHSEASSFMIGASLVADGGFSIQ